MRGTAVFPGWRNSLRNRCTAVVSQLYIGCPAALGRGRLYSVGHGRFYVNHVYPEKWEVTAECDHEGCQAGRIKTFDAAGESCEVECQRCHGTGRIAVRGPFDVYQVNHEALNPDKPLQIPPMGYVQKDLATIDTMNRLYEGEIKHGFEAINMEVLGKVGEDQSGIAKTIDRQDLDQFLQGYANHVFKYVVPNIIYYSLCWRYGPMGIDATEFMPEINEPVSFNVMAIDELVGELNNMKQSCVSTALQIGIQEDIIEKRFNDDYEKAKYRAILKLDPLPGKTPDELVNALGSGIITREQWFVHEFITDLVHEAIESSDTFLELPYMKQKETIYSIARAKLQPAAVLPTE